MQKQHANIDFTGFRVDEISPLAKSIVNLMTANAVIFPAPPVAMPAVTNLISKYDTVLSAIDYPGKSADLAAARLALDTALKTNGVFVNGIAKNDLTILEKSGYPISKPNLPVGDLQPPDSVKVTNGTAPATFNVDIATVAHADGYLFAFAPVSNTDDDPNNWTVRWCPKHSATFNGFTAGMQYKFAACGVGSSKNVFWTKSPAMLYAQG